jgi:hypothetical protein
VRSVDQRRQGTDQESHATPERDGIQGLDAHRPCGVEHPEAPQLAAEEGVPGGVEVRREREVLEDRLDAQAPARADDAGADGLAAFLTTLIERSGMSSRLSQLNVDQSALPDLADDATKQWTSSHNPRPMGKEEFLELYQRAW